MKNLTLTPSMTLVIIAILAALLLAACASGDDGIEDGVLRLTFDGESCTIEGHTDFKAGLVELIYVNESEEPASIAFNQHTGDETIQDAIDHFGEAPSSIPCPEWKRDVVRSYVQPGDTYRWEGDLEAATYHMVCYQSYPLRVWFGTGLTVED